MKRKYSKYLQDDIWKRRFDYENELLIYKCLCHPMKKKEKEKINREQRFDSFEDWENHIRGIFAEMPIYRKKEFCKYASNKIRHFETFDRLRDAVAVPIIVGLVISAVSDDLKNAISAIEELTGIASDAIEAIYSMNTTLWINIAAFMLIIMCVLLSLLRISPVFVLLVIVMAMIMSLIRVSDLRKAFWGDCIEIVQSLIDDTRKAVATELS